MRFAAVLSVLLASLPLAAVAAERDTAQLDGKTYEQEGAKWSDRLERTEVNPLLCKPLKGACYFDAPRIRNYGEQDIRCVVRVIYPQPNKFGIQNLETTEIIRPLSERAVAQTLAVPLKLSPASFESSCVPLAELVPLDTPAECTLTMKIPGMGPGDFYPPGSIRRNEQGPVVVDFTVNDANAAVDIAIARSSEHPDLDGAARKIVERSRYETNCPGKRFRKKIPFTLAE